jgi:hypothetical protein
MLFAVDMQTIAAVAAGGGALIGGARLIVLWRNRRRHSGSELRAFEFMMTWTSRKDQDPAEQSDSGPDKVETPNRGT